LKIDIGKYRKNRKINIKIHDYDTWNLDDTLALIIAPALKKFKENHQGVPDEFSRPGGNDNESQQLSFDFYKETYDWAFEEKQKGWEETLDLMIWAFEQYTSDWESQFWSGESDLVFEENESGLTRMVSGPNHTMTWDKKSYKEHYEKIMLGISYFAKYYGSLWD
jgi:hypothetical protein